MINKHLVRKLNVLSTIVLIIINRHVTSEELVTHNKAPLNKTPYGVNQAHFTERELDKPLTYTASSWHWPSPSLGFYSGETHPACRRFP